MKKILCKKYIKGYDVPKYLLVNQATQPIKPVYKVKTNEEENFSKFKSC